MRNYTYPEIARARTELLEKADDRKILDNLKNYPTGRFSMKRDGSLGE